MTAPRFRLGPELGAGTSGRVARAVLLEPWADLPVGAPVAVKHLRPELERDPAARARFDSEVQAGGAVRHPNVVRALATGADERGRYVVMPFVPGASLREVLEREGALPEPLVRRIGHALGAGLAALHEAGFSHGDIKPENVRLDGHGEAVLLDLGFARPLAAVAETTVAPRPGSLPYLAPEQARGGPGGAASDVFALGVVLYEPATGAHPFAARAAGSARSGSSGATARAALSVHDADLLLAAIAEARPTSASRLAPRVSPFLDLVLADLLRRDPARRPSAAELVARLAEQEAGTWWRSELELGSAARRGGVLEEDGGHLTPFLGRERELASLADAWDEARARPVAAWVRGAPGMGKSRLVTEFARAARRAVEPPLVLYGRCHELDEDRPCQPVLRMLERWLRLPPGVPPGARERAELATLVPPSTAEALAEALATGSSPAGASAAVRSLPVALGAWIAALSARAGLVLHLDDAPWAGEGTLASLEHAAEASRARAGESRLLVVLGERTGAQARAPAAYAALAARLEALGVRTRAIELGPLSEADVSDLVGRAFHASAPRLRLAQVLWSRSRGNPGLLAEILRGLLSRGEARAREDGLGLELAIEPDRLPLPSSVRAAIASAYRALPAADRAWLRRLAVVGGRIEREFLLRAFPASDGAELDLVLARLARAGWLVSAGARWRFARPAQREAVYRALSRDQRKKLHGAAAVALAPAAALAPAVDASALLEGPAQSAVAASPLEDEYQRAFHLRAAQDDERLLEVVPALLERLKAGGQPQRIAPLARWGLEALARVPERPERARLGLALLEASADASDLLGLRGDQRAALDRLADAAADPEADPRSAGRLYLLHARYAISTGQYGLARGELRNAVELLERANASAELADALRRLALVQAHVGELTEARQLARRAMRAHDGAPQRAGALVARGTIDLLEDDVERALKRADDAIELLRGAELAPPGLLASAHMLRARVHKSLGAPQRALGAAAHAVRLARLAGERRLEAEALARLGQLHLDVDRPDEAESELREALRIATEIEDRRGQALARAFLGILLWERGTSGAAWQLEDSARLAEEMGLNRLVALSCAVRARIALIESRDHAAALEWSGRATAILERYGAELFDRIVIQGTRALVLATAGMPDEARGVERALRQKLERENARLRSPLTRLRQSRAGQSLLDAVTTSEGPLYPRARPA